MIGAASLLAYAGCSNVTPTDVLRNNYLALLAKYVEADQGLGLEVRFEGESEQPMTYALILMAEVARYRHSETAEGGRRIKAAFSWLTDNSDLDQDHLAGWGIPLSWDPFSDGTPDPPNTPATITTALVIEGFLRVLETPLLIERRVLSAEEVEHARSLVRQCWWRWSSSIWTDDGKEAYFWYTPLARDAYFVTNVSSMWIGIGARMAGQSWVVEDPPLLSDLKKKIAAGAASLIQQATSRKNRPYWTYIATPNALNQSKPNDLLHHAYTLWGLEQVRDLRAIDVSFPWTREAAVESVQAFFLGGRIHEYPQDVSYEGGSRFMTGPARLWGVGGLLAFVCRYGASRTMIRGISRSLDQDYGPFPDLRLYPREFLKDDQFYARYGAHVLWGLSECVFTDREARAIPAG